MKHAIILAAVVSIAATAQTETSSLWVEEVFSVETSEDLEASLTDGYPMPWLAEILEDETIPEEDRYWLDCRVRAVIARDLHLFYNRNGEAVHVEAEGGIRNGESYWRETFIVEPNFIDRRASSIDHPDANLYNWQEFLPEYETPYHFIRTPGYLCNRFGEKIGDIATTDIKIRLSRDGSVGIYTSGWNQHSNPSRVFFLNSHNDVNELIVGPRVTSNSGMQCVSMAEDGSLSAIVCLRWMENREQQSDLDLDFSEGKTLMVFTGTGELLYSRKMSNLPVYMPLFSPDNQFIAYACSDTTYLLDAQTGETIYAWENYGPIYPCFTRNSKYLCVSSVELSRIYNCETCETTFEFSENPYPSYGFTRNSHIVVSADNSLSVVTGDRCVRPGTGREFYNEIFLGKVLFSSERMENYRVQEVSPNGCFIDLQDYCPFMGNLWDGFVIPYTVLRIREDR